ncbi:Phosphatidylinositol/phosphatidylcholine transfer protein SFH11 [Smittium culicis]|uniref:Phosphatidylinositol/phosphatidylcholine transfer protein SFH11 n=2 Tax=Smittium culicis TaxID=133412 RepID=A0A1R1WZ91_9FUNG|nr:Phosphatidylinositol/phosphatidylcholine transfer protein SFH11 [Smittium culicis]
MENLDNISPERQAEVIESVRAALDPKISEYCSNSEKIKEMIDAWYKWRIDDKIDEFLIPQPDNNFPIPYPIRGYESFSDSNLTAGKDVQDSMMRMNSLFGGGCWHKADKNGNPVYIDRLGAYDIPGIPKKITISELLENHYLLQEFCLNSIMPSCSKTSGKEITKQTVIFDLNGIGLSSLNRSALTMLKEMLKNDQLYFPESMIHTFFINAPSYFLTIWSAVKGFVDPRVISKITFVKKNEIGEVLLKYIDADSLPAMYGGNCHCSHMPGGCIPSPPKRNYIDLPRAAYTNFTHRSTLDYENSTFSSTFSPPQIELQSPKVVEKSGWFGSKKTVVVEPTDRYVVVYFSTSGGRGIVFESLWKSTTSTADSEPKLLYPEMLFESHRSPTILEIKLPNDLPAGEMVLNFRLPRADEGASSLPTLEESKTPITLEYEVMMESDILKKYELQPVDRSI